MHMYVHTHCIYSMYIDTVLYPWVHGMYLHMMSSFFYTLYCCPGWNFWLNKIKPAPNVRSMFSCLCLGPCYLIYRRVLFSYKIIFWMSRRMSEPFVSSNCYFSFLLLRKSFTIFYHHEAPTRAPFSWGVCKLTIIIQPFSRLSFAIAARFFDFASQVGWYPSEQARSYFMNKQLLCCSFTCTLLYRQFDGY